MIQLAECFAWCMVQVTLFTVAAAIVYWLVGRQQADRNARLLAVCFGMIAMLTFASVSPWPQWPVSNMWQPAAAQVDTTPAEVPDTSIFGVPSTDPAAVALFDASSVEGVTPLPQEPLLGISIENTDTARWWLPAVWAAWIFAAIGALRFLIGLAFVRRYRRRSCPIDDAPLCQEFETLRAELGAPASTDLRESPTLGVAATVGWHKPLVLLPSSWRAWTTDERRAVLAHELAHVAQRHFPVWFASQLATVAHFYHPLVHWLGRRLRLEQELAADQIAAQTFGDARRYATVLAGLAIGHSRPAAIVGLGLFMSRPLLMRRIAMLRETTEHRRPSRLVRALALLLVAAATIAVVGLRTSSATDGNTMTTPGGTLTIKPDIAPMVITGKIESVVPTAEAPTSSLQPTIPASDNGIDNPLTTSRYITGDNGRWATALLQVSSDLPSLRDAPSDANQWKVFSRTQSALLLSILTLNAAVRDPEIAKLPVIAAQDDPASWLKSNLDVGFIPDSEILFVRIKCDSQNQQQSQQIIDAVVRAYMEQIVAGDRERKQAIRDTLAKSYAKLSDELQTKMSEYQSLADEIGVSEQAAESELLLREITEVRRARSELEQRLSEIQADYLVAAEKQKEKPADVEAIRQEHAIRAKIFNQQLDSLNERSAELTEAYRNLGQDSVDLKVRRAELEQLQAVTRDMAIKLEMMDVESVMPDRVRVIQWAM